MNTAGYSTSALGGALSAVRHRPSSQQAALRAIMEEHQRRWQELLAQFMQMSDTELRAALGSPVAEVRFTAAYVVGERGLPWHRDLIPLLEDGADGVRQSARRSLIVVSFLALNPDIAGRLQGQRPAHTSANRPPDEDAPAAQAPRSAPASRSVPPVDFGPQPAASVSARAEAAQRWTKWWDDREPGAPRVATLRSAPPQAEPDPDLLAQDLLQAIGRFRWDVLDRYQSSKGGHFTEALALAANQAEGESRRRIRAALSLRMTRMKDTTLVRYLADDDAEIRRAAALGLAQRDSVACADKVIELLLDTDSDVERAAHAALRHLSNGQDFGPAHGAPEAERLQAAARWRDWWKAR